MPNYHLQHDPKIRNQDYCRDTYNAPNTQTPSQQRMEKIENMEKQLEELIEQPPGFDKIRKFLNELRSLYDEINGSKDTSAINKFMELAEKFQSSFLPFMAAERAKQAYDGYVTGKREWLIEKFGEYYSKDTKTKNNDCYTFMLKLLNQSAEWEVFAAPIGIDTTRMTPAFKEKICGLQRNRKYNINIRTTSLKLNLQVGDIIGVDRSPNDTRNTHWGMVVEMGGELRVIGRGCEVQCHTLSYFFKNAKKIDLVRYGNPALSESFICTYSEKSGYNVSKCQTNGF